MSEFALRDPDPDKKAPHLTPIFFSEAVKMDFKSREAGRPIFEDQEFVKFLIPGNRGSVAVQRVTEEHKAEWPKEYEAFAHGKEAPLNGTPLSEWAVSSMTKARVEELIYFNVRTVEQLAMLNDAAIGNLGMGTRELREQAKTWLEIAASGSAPIERLLSENDRLREDNERLAAQMQGLSAQMQAMEDRINARKVA